MFNYGCGKLNWSTPSGIEKCPEECQHVWNSDFHNPETSKNSSPDEHPVDFSALMRSRTTIVVISLMFSVLLLLQRKSGMFKSFLVCFLTPVNAYVCWNSVLAGFVCKPSRISLRPQLRLLGSTSSTLFQDLKDWRKRTAEELQQPLFQILSNNAIEAIAVQRPTDLFNLAGISGIGPKKLKKYGRPILNFVQKHKQDDDHLTLEAISEQNRVSDATFWAEYKAPKPKKKKKEKPEDVVIAEVRRKKRIEMLSDSAMAELKWPDIQLSDLNTEQQAAAAHIMAGKNVFLTGSAGTGKTFLLRYVIQEMEKRYEGSVGAVAVTAPTGIAAINIGGQTIHSFAGIGLGKSSYENYWSNDHVDLSFFFIVVKLND